MHAVTNALSPQNMPANQSINMRGRKQHGIVTFAICFVWLCIQQTLAIHSNYISEIPTNCDSMMHEVKTLCDECG
jgi:hypothetical protein